MPALRSSVRSEEVDFGRLKDLVKKLGGLLVFDGDEPSLVVLSYDKFKKLEVGVSEEIPVSRRNNFDPVRSLARAKGASPEDLGEATSNGVDPALEKDMGLKYGQNMTNGVQEDEAIVEKLNQEILALKEEIRQKEEAELMGNEQSTEAAAELVDPAPFLD